MHQNTVRGLQLSKKESGASWIRSSLKGPQDQPPPVTAQPKGAHSTTDEDYVALTAAPQYLMLSGPDAHYPQPCMARSGYMAAAEPALYLTTTIPPSLITVHCHQCTEVRVRLSAMLIASPGMQLVPRG